MMKTTIPKPETLQELTRKVNSGNATGIRRSADPAPAWIPLSEWKDTLPNPFQRDIIRMIAILFGPMLAGAIVIPLLMIIFSLLGYPY